MASVIDAFNEAFADRFSYLKFIIYAIPVYFSAQFFIKGQMQAFYFLGTITAILLLGVMTSAINNIRLNNQVVMTLNPLKLAWVMAKTAVAVVPIACILYFIGYAIVTYIPIPPQLEPVENVIKIIVWSILGSIMLTSYLSYSKFLSIKQAYNFKAISESCIDVLVNLFFFLPQLALANVILIAPFLYIYYLFKWPFEHWTFIACMSIVAIINISIIANYYAQAAFEIIRGNNSDYDEKHNMSYLDYEEEDKI